MEPLKYKVIKTDEQYDEYCNILKELLFINKKELTPDEEDVADLLTDLVQKYDEEHSIFEELDPVVMLRSFMDDFKMKSVDMANLLSVSPSLISDVLNYRRGFSKEMIRKLSERFKVDQKLFNRPYALVKPKRKKATPKKAAAKKPAKPKASTPPRPARIKTIPIKKPAKSKKLAGHK